MPETSAIGGMVLAAVVVAADLGVQASAQTMPSQNVASPQEILLRIEAPLDEPRGLCVDIPGHRERVNVNRPLVVHTCKWDIWNLDERFDANAVDKGGLRMPSYGLCAGVQSADEAADIILGACDGAPVRSWQFEGGRFRLAADPNMCLMAGAEPSRLTPGGQRLPSRHVARSLALETCRDTASQRQLRRRVPPGS